MQLAFLILLSLSFGSFANVLRVRLPLKESIANPRSNCPVCGQYIKWFDNIPLISWLFLRAKCRSCAAVIPLSYPMVEILFPICILLIISNSSYIFSTSIYFNLIYFFVFTFYIFIISIIDFETFTIPNSLIISGLLISLFFNTINTIFFTSNIDTFISRLSAPFVGFLIVELLTFLLFIIFSKEAFGAGDSKFLALIGSWLGFKGMFFSFLLAIYFSAAFSLLGILLKKLNKSSKIPFGPFLAFSSYLVLLFGINYWEDLLTGLRYLQT